MKPLPSQLSVGQALALMRAGGTIAVAHQGDSFCITPIDLIENLERDQNGPGCQASNQSLLITGTRAESIGLTPLGETVKIPLTGAYSTAVIRAFADPLLAPLTPAKPKAAAGNRLDDAAIELCKLAGLLPAAVISRDLSVGPPRISVDTIERYRTEQATSLTPLGAARVPLAAASDTRIVPFRPDDGRMEHLAILIGDPENADAPLCRIHSECFTGDLLASLRCDCGEQLQGSIRAMAKEGVGVLLYLAQEGRGIGLANKLRAYQLQDGGLDTVEANQHLGFEPDERDFLSAATMLRALGITKVRLMSNNPTKIDGLARNGIEVASRVAHEFAANDFNRDYLQTKKVKSGHMLKLDLAKPTGTDD